MGRDKGQGESGLLLLLLMHTLIFCFFPFLSFPFLSSSLRLAGGGWSPSVVWLLERDECEALSKLNPPTHPPIHPPTPLLAVEEIGGHEEF